jgi:molybdopterin converting factor small subunit
MTVQELIKKLEKMPKYLPVFTEDDKYVWDVKDVEHDDRDYVIIRRA